MTTPKTTYRLRHRIADVLLIGSAAYLAIFLWAPIWFPFDLVGAMAILGLAALIGDYKHKWWPITPYIDKEHEVVLSVENQKGKTVK